MNNSERFNDPFQWFIQKTLFHKSENYSNEHFIGSLKGYQVGM